MSGDWIKMRAELQTHPKVVRIMSALQADKLRVIGALHAVWCLFDTHSEDGKLEGYTPDAVDTFIGWIGFSRAMLGVSWLEEEAGTLAAPRFDEHNSQSAKRRATNSKGKKRVRKMSASDADKKVTREEKRREDINTSTQFGKPNGASVFSWQEKSRADAIAAIEFLNRKLEKNFKPVAANVDLIMERLAEGATLQECKCVIANRIREWNDRDDMRKFLRIKTLFDKVNYANYVGELIPQEAE